MKKVSRRTQDKFMRALLSAAGSTRAAKPDHPALESLRKRKDFEHVMMVLEGLGLVMFVRRNGGQFLWYGITPAGCCYFEKRADERYRMLVNGVLIPVLVALITTTVTVYILPTLGESAKQWLKGYQQQRKEPLSAVETTNGPEHSPETYPVYPEQTLEPISMPS